MRFTEQLWKHTAVAGLVAAPLHVSAIIPDWELVVWNRQAASLAPRASLDESERMEHAEMPWKEMAAWAAGNCKIARAHFEPATALGGWEEALLYNEVLALLVFRKPEQLIDQAASQWHENYPASRRKHPRTSYRCAFGEH